MAEFLKTSFDIPEVELESGHRSEFSVWVGTTCVARKTLIGFPDENTLLMKVASHLD